jgi:hypothetical protein
MLVGEAPYLAGHQAGDAVAVEPGRLRRHSTKGWRAGELLARTSRDARRGATATARSSQARFCDI